MKIRSKQKMKHRIATLLFTCFFCLVSFDMVSAVHADGKPMNIRKNLPEFKGVEQKHRKGNNFSVEVLYFDRSSDTGIVRKNNSYFKVEIQNGSESRWTELEGYPEDLPSPRSHVDYYHGKIISMEN